MYPLNIYAGEDGFERLAKLLSIPEPELSSRRQALKRSFMPFKVTEHFANLIAGLSDPYRTQLLNIVVPFEGDRPFVGRFDPYGNTRYRLREQAFLQHKYKKTLLLHIDDFCVANCQFCYKVNEIRHESSLAHSVNEKVDAALNYLAACPEIDNVLFSGGDPASFRRTSELVNLIQRLLSSPSIRVVRFATKGLAYDPVRFTDGELLEFFSSVNRQYGKQISIIVQINHPAELSRETISAIHELRSVGVQVRGQPALMRGINDDVETLIALQRAFLDHQIISYYLTVFMPVRGVEQYALPLDMAFRNVSEAKRNLSGLEKKGVLLASHDFGKFEICGFIPSANRPEKIVLKWHQAAMRELLPVDLVNSISTEPEDLVVLDYCAGEMFCIDHVLRENRLPYYDSDGNLHSGS